MMLLAPEPCPASTQVPMKGSLHNGVDNEVDLKSGVDHESRVVHKSRVDRKSDVDHRSELREGREPGGSLDSCKDSCLRRQGCTVRCVRLSRGLKLNISELTRLNRIHRTS